MALYEVTLSKRAKIENNQIEWQLMGKTILSTTPRVDDQAVIKRCLNFVLSLIGNKQDLFDIDITQVYMCSDGYLTPKLIKNKQGNKRAYSEHLYINTQETELINIIPEMERTFLN